MSKHIDHGKTTRANLQQQFIPDRLRQLRVALGYSSVDFSDKIEVSRQALNQFETNRITPSFDTMKRIELVTGFPMSYFFKPLTQVNEGPFLFRANLSSLKKTKEMSRFLMLQLQEIFEYYESFLDFTPVNIPLLEFDLNSSIEDIEDIAVEVRKHWGLGLGPISHIYRLLENNGVIIGQLNKRLDKIDAFSQWRNGRPFIITGSDDFSACRLRLNAMHEFGHLLLHTDSEYEERANKDAEFYAKVEEQAYRFAGAFLLPREAFLNELYSTSIQHLVELKERWGVSIAAMIRRCKDLEIISESKYESLMRQIKKHGKVEPLDDVIQREKPTAFSQAAKMIVEHGLKSKQEIIQELRTPIALTEVLNGLEPGYFTEQIESAKIVNLRDLNTQSDRKFSQN
ncbi:XRE family transcriptional regulator [Priestia sp. BR_2]